MYFNSDICEHFHFRTQKTPASNVEAPMITHVTSADGAMPSEKSFGSF
jgi:hypothetical protein